MSSLRAPERLIRSDTASAHLLRHANRQYQGKIHEPEAFSRLDARLLAPKPGRLGGVLALSAGLVGAIWVLVLRPAAPLELTAEPLPARTAGAPPPITLTAPKEGVAATQNEPSPTPADVVPKPPRPSERRTARPLGTRKATTATLGSQSESSECLRLAREGDSEAAEECFRARADGTGLSAELALYELSRMRRDLLDEPIGALAALDEHRSRFPSGGLRAEVELTRVELLVRIGRKAEALSEVERLLASGTGPERDEELARIRDELLKERRSGPSGE